MTPITSVHTFHQQDAKHPQSPGKNMWVKASSSMMVSSNLFLLGGQFLYLIMV